MNTETPAQCWETGHTVETENILGCLQQISSINCHQNIGTTSRDSEMGPKTILMMTAITTQCEDIDFFGSKRDIARYLGHTIQPPLQ